jgi:hypothetical protein
MGKLNLSPDIKLWGTNFIPTAAQVTEAGGTVPWIALWRDWQWSTWIKPQIDYMVGNNVGCNSIRIFGASFGVVQGYYSREVYESRLFQLMDYLKALGVYAYYCGDYFGAQISDGFSAKGVSGCADIIAPTFVKLQTYSNFIGFDVIQEINFLNVTIQTLRDFLAALRSRGVVYPMTYSTAAELTSGSGEATVNQVADVVDHFDFHLYYGPQVRPVASYENDTRLVNYYLTNYPSKDILFGEFGVHQDTPTDLQNTDLTSFFQLANCSHKNIRGGMVWASSDQASASDNRWGFYDDTFAARQNKLNIIRRYTGGTLAKAVSINR